MPANDDEASGPPPHPLDRVWFHPSELGATLAAIRSRQPNPWFAALAALVLGVAGTLGILFATGQLTEDRTTSATLGGVPTDAGAANLDWSVNLVRSAGRSLVTIAFTPAAGEIGRLGSGVSLGGGRIVTAAHVLPATLADGTLSVVTVVGRVFPAQLIGVDPETDLALLQLGPGSVVAAARIGSPTTLQGGQTVLAVSSGADGQPAASVGNVYALRRFAIGPGGVTLTGLIEADVRTDGAPPGSALVDASGAVVGIFAGPRRMAVPIDVARDVAEQLSATGQAAHGGLGVLGVDALDRNGGGVRVKALAPGSPAETSGLAVDDVITAVNDEDVTTVGDLMDALRRRKPQDPVQIVALRGNKRVTFNATLTRSSTLPSWPAPFG